MISVAGVEYEAKSLTLPQVRACRKADENESDVLAIAWSYGVPVEAAREWFNAVPAGEAATAIHAVFEASGLVEGAAPKS